jgi:hypothetical protein
MGVAGRLADWLRPSQFRATRKATIAEIMPLNTALITGGSNSQRLSARLLKFFLEICVIPPDLVHIPLQNSQAGRNI